MTVALFKVVFFATLVVLSTCVLGVHVENQIQSKTSIPFERDTCVGVPDCHNLVCPPGMIRWCLAGICRCIK
ncbi:unnamed protein product [Lactuca virosa]|uniref:Uncharacterized protein n=1 Tax=Lactuca virosa TaxID=75947 RepID=A0AAU9MPA6_9ASTR|nr:unnamed protein product [Lactuca virosa]